MSSTEGVKPTEPPLNEPSTNQESTAAAKQSRRNFIGRSLGGGAAIATLPLIGGGVGYRIASDAAEDDNLNTTNRPNANNSNGSNPDDRASRLLEIKVDTAQRRYDETLALPKQTANGDEQRYESANFYGNFSKTLPSNTYGEVDPEAYTALTTALETGEPDDFDKIPRHAGAPLKLANPQGALLYQLSASDGHTTRINHSHPIRSAELAGEMVEVYWQALTRDVPFAQFETDQTVAAAVEDLNSMTITPGPSVEGATTAAQLFRGETAGDLTGPYVSQFLLQDFAFGPFDIQQKFATPTATDFLTDTETWLEIQRGFKPTVELTLETERRYIYNGRVLGEYVHRDVTCQAYLDAALYLLGHGAEMLDESNPYRSKIENQGGFVSFGSSFTLDLVVRAANLALTGAWYQKWHVHRTIRPEALSGRVHFTLTGDREYELHDDLLGSDAVNRVQNRNGTALLPVAYPEGSPTHPSYPAGHATIAGACVTVLKALFAEDAAIPNPVVADTEGRSLLPYDGALTVGGELNKLANNISLGRDVAGVHYRQDGIQGLKAGEQQAIALLQDQTLLTNESGFEGFNLTTFDGTSITIEAGSTTSN